jgi:hypoxanthine phosphoribosyltransferase
MPKINVLFTPETIAQKVQQLGKQITRDYQDRELCVVGVLKGSFMFFADLVRQIDLPITCEFIAISSYGNDTESSGVVQITSDLTQSIEGKDVLIVEDIVDTGHSMRYLIENFQTRRPRQIKICCLLDKSDNRKTLVPVDYVGFRIPNEFVVGYGLDVAGKHRNLPYIGVYCA